MGMIETNVAAKEITLSAVVTRADGSVENLGVIAHYISPRERLSRLLRKISGNHSSSQEG